MSPNALLTLIILNIALGNMYVMIWPNNGESTCRYCVLISSMNAFIPTHIRIDNYTHICSFILTRRAGNSFK